MLFKLFRPVRSKRFRHQQTSLRCETLEDRRVLATIMVTDAGDSGAGTLRAAIEQANMDAGEDCITFDASLDGETISLSTTDMDGTALAITDDLIIDASSLDSLTIDASPLDVNPGTADGRGARVFDATTGTSVELIGLTVMGGDTLEPGGGIRARGPLTITDSRFERNHSFESGSAVAVEIDGQNNVDVTISNSTFADNGRLRWGFSSNAEGGAVSANIINGTDNTLTIQSSIFENNGHEFDTGVSLRGGAAYLYGNAEFTIENSAFSGNDSYNGPGGAVYAYAYSGTLTISTSTFDENRAVESSGGALAISNYGGTATIRDTIISGNNADNNGGGIIGETGGGGSLYLQRLAVVNNIAFNESSPSRGGGAFLFADDQGEVNVANSTVSGNLSGDGGGGLALSSYYNSTTPADSGAVSLANVTVADNTGGSRMGTTEGGGGVFADVAATNRVEVLDSILADNTTTAGDDDLEGNFNVNFSLVENVGTGMITLTDSIQGMDPMLEDLAQNNALTLTHAIPVGSPAVDAGDPTTSGDFDQRGMGFDRVIDGDVDTVARVDMGAFEIQFPENVAPVADAGLDQIVVLGSGDVTLDGTDSEDPDLGPMGLSYEWVVLSGPGLGGTLTDADMPTATFTPDTAGVYEIQLSVNDGDKTDTDTVIIGVSNNSLPVADASMSDISGEINTDIDLDASLSSDVDGQPLTYMWSVVTSPAGSSPVITDDTAETTTMMTDLVGRYVLELVANDGLDDSAADQLEVLVFDSLVNTPPFVMVSPDEATIVSGDSTTFSADGTFDVDPTDTLTYAWSIESGPDGGDGMLSDAAAVTTDFTASVAGDYMLQLVVSDDTESAAPVSVMVQVETNEAPTANVSLSANKGIAEQPIRLDGSRSTDPNTSQMLSYQWTVVESPDGSSPVIDDDMAAMTTLTTDLEGLYRVSLVVGDGELSSDPVVFRIDVANSSTPSANVSLSSNFGSVDMPIGLNGTRSTDPDDDPLSYQWTVVDSPMGSTVDIADDTAAATTFMTDTAGMYRMQLVVDDSTNTSAPVAFDIEVVAQALPIANVSLSESSGLIDQSIALNGSRSSDPGGDPLTYEWSIVDSPEGSNPVIDDPTAESTTWTADIAGAYRVALVVNNGTDDSRRVTFMTDVTDVARPVADTSGSETTGMVSMDVALDGSDSTDPEGGSLMYLWTIISMPTGANATIADPFAATTTFNADMAGDYVVRLVVSNNSEKSVPADLDISVVAPAPLSAGASDPSVALDFDADGVDAFFAELEQQPQR